MKNYSVELIGVTKIVNEKLLEKLKSDSAEELVMYCARVSNPANQDSGKPGLLNYCAKKQHWSIFEMANMVVEIETSRAISAQILRHRSFSFQEFSQRYAQVQEVQVYPARSQDQKNRQNSNDDMNAEDQQWFTDAQQKLTEFSSLQYNEALERGVAKEQARFLLPMASKTVLYMNGPIRSWIHYLSLRSAHGTQKEHMDIAEAIRKIFCEQFPIIAEALEWE